MAWCILQFQALFLFPVQQALRLGKGLKNIWKYCMHTESKPLCKTDVWGFKKK